MPNLILIHGPIASGKSTLCKQLLKQLKGYAFVDRAYLKQMLKPCGKQDAKIIANKTTMFMVEELMKLKKNILVQEQSRSNLKKVTNKFGVNYGVYSVYLTYDLKKAIKRDRLRKKKAGDIKTIKKNYQKIKPDVNDVVIDTGKNGINQCIKKILLSINS